MLRAALALAAATTIVLCGTAPATADDGLSIGHVEPGKDGSIKVLVSVPSGSTVAPEDVSVSIDGTTLDSTAETAASAGGAIRRTTVIAFDTSKSMNKQGRIEAARAAASTFLESVPDDVFVGIVTFDANVETALAPTQDREAAQTVLDELELATQTRLNQGVIEAVRQAGSEGQRRLLVLSDGRDTSKTPAADVIDAIQKADVNVDVVVLDQAGSSLKPLKAMSDAGEGAVISADADSLNAAFSQEAAALARQVLVTATLPDGVSGDEATISVSVSTADGTQTASTYARIREPQTGPDSSSLTRPEGPAFTVSRGVMLGGVLAIGVGLLLFLGVVLVPRKAKPGTVEDRILAYGAGGVAPGINAGVRADPTPALNQAKDAAAKMLHRNRGLEQKIAQRLEGAGSSLKPAEWLLLHSAVTLLAGMVGVTMSGGNVPLIIVSLAVGWLLPKLWLRRKRRKRVKAFNTGLADTLQLMAGSLAAGMSLAQSVDTVVREGQEPISGEFKRVLVETRLGVSLEEALEGISERLESKDFAWVVMAIRIQRQVGGNLGELLTTVAATLRERDYVRRQVQSLAAEGKLSAYILGGMPPGIMIFLLLVKPDYIMPLFTNAIGYVLLAAAAVLLGLAAFLMSRIIKVEV